MNVLRHNRRWAWLGLPVFLGGTTASVAAGALAGLLACHGLADPAARLACYDREAAALKSATVPAVGKAAAAPSPQPSRPLDPKQTFGLPEDAVAAKEIAAGTRARAVSDIAARLVGLAHTGDGRIVFTLDNGQVWSQLLPEGDMLAKVGDGVTITRGWLGSYWLQMQSRRGCKVTRLR